MCVCVLKDKATTSMQHVKEKCKTLEKETMLVCQALSERDAEKICVNVCVRVCVCARERKCVQRSVKEFYSLVTFSTKKNSWNKKWGEEKKGGSTSKTSPKRPPSIFFIEMSFSLLTFAFFSLIWDL